MGYYEPYGEIPPKDRDLSRAITSLREELEAVDYYNQRAVVSADAKLSELMIHNRDEEIEHAAMLIEWLRREIPEFDKELRQYLFTESSLVAVEAGATSVPAVSVPGLNIGSLKK